MRWVILGAAALAGGVSARYLTTPRAVADPPQVIVPSPLTQPFQIAGAPKFRWEIAWQKSAPDFGSASFSPGGDNLAWVDRRGSVRRVVSANGETVWQTAPLRGVNRVSASPRGAVVAYSGLNPAYPSFRILDARYGDRKSVMIPVDGAIWNMTTLPDGAGGEQAILATGKRLLYRVPLRPDVTWPPQPVLLPGIADTWDAATDTDSAATTLLLGTWQAGGVGVWGGGYNLRWRYPESDLRRTYRVHLSRDGTTAIATSGIGPRGEQAQLHAWDVRTGKSLWIKKLHGDDARAAVSADGQRIVVTFRRGEGGGENSPALQTTPNMTFADTTPGRKIALFDRAGQLFSGKGGSFFAPELVCLSPDGNRITIRNNEEICTLDTRWRRIARLRLSATPGKPAPSVRQIVPLPDASGLLLVTGDGLMTLYKAL